MKGIILAGGKGTRLQPATFAMNKHMIPILNEPMILYPLDTLKELGCKDILIVSGGNHVGQFAEFLRDGSDYGVRLTYKVQKEAGGIAQALSLAEDFVGKNDFVVILGDNIYGNTPVKPPEGYCGIVLEEKPKDPKSKMAVTGLYFYTPAVFDFIRSLKPSTRGEMEITDVNNWCLKNLDTATLEYEGFWSDAGTPESLATVVNWAMK